MRTFGPVSAILFIACWLGAGCNHSRSNGANDGGPKTCDYCNGIEYVPCNADGTPGTPVTCADGQVCVDGVGCADCAPGGTTCVGNEVHDCGPDGKAGALVSTCDAQSGNVCVGGQCLEGCAAAETDASNVGCEFWSVQLDNEEVPMSLAASQPFGVVISNAGQATANVTIERNDGTPNGTLQLAMVMGLSLPPGTVQMVTLPQRWIDGSTGMDNNGPGTMLSSNAYRIKSDQPLVAY